MNDMILPDPPTPKHYWRVTENIFVGFPYVKLMRKAWIFSYEEDSMWTDSTAFETVEAEVSYLCERLNDRYSHRKFLEQASKELSGDYSRGVI